MIEGYTEKEVVDTIIRVTKRLAPKYTFGYYSLEDIEQEAFLLAWDSDLFESYDGRAPLENYLYRCIGNKLKNFKRKNYMRTDAIEGGRGYNQAKQNLMDPLGIDEVKTDEESSMYTSFNYLDNVCNEEALSVIDKYLEKDLRVEFLKYRDGATITKPRRESLEQRIIEILEEHGHVKID